MTEKNITARSLTTHHILLGLSRGDGGTSGTRETREREKGKHKQILITVTLKCHDVHLQQQFNSNDGCSALRCFAPVDQSQGVRLRIARSPARSRGPGLCRRSMAWWASLGSWASRVKRRLTKETMFVIAHSPSLTTLQVVDTLATNHFESILFICGEPQGRRRQKRGCGPSVPFQPMGRGSRRPR